MDECSAGEKREALERLRQVMSSISSASCIISPRVPSLTRKSTAASALKEDRSGCTGLASHSQSQLPGGIGAYPGFLETPRIRLRRAVAKQV